MQPFGKEWFKKHQGKLVWALNNRFTSTVFRGILGIDYAGRIDHLDTNHFTVVSRMTKRKAYLTKTFVPQEYYAVRLYTKLKPIWWAMHVIDFVIDPVVPQYSFGFSTITVSPSASTSSPADGEIQAGPAGTWAGARDAATAPTAMTSPYMRAVVDFTGGQYYVYRTITCFDTSAIGSGQTISATTKIRGYGVGATAGTIAFTKATPSSTSNFATSDYAQVGSSKCTADITSISTGAYNDFTITDLTVVNATGITTIGLREVTHDINNSAATTQVQIYFNSADAGSNPPQLVVDYVAAAGAARHFLTTLGVA